jgi:hypothetical protein
MTSLYTFRLIFIAFHGEAKTEAHAGHGISHWLPLSVLIVLSTFIGALIVPPLAGVLPESVGHAGGDAQHSLKSPRAPSHRRYPAGGPAVPRQASLRGCRRQQRHRPLPFGLVVRRLGLRLDLRQTVRQAFTLPSAMTAQRSARPDHRSRSAPARVVTPP